MTVLSSSILVLKLNVSLMKAEGCIGIVKRRGPLLIVNTSLGLGVNNIRLLVGGLSKTDATFFPLIHKAIHTNLD